MLLRSLSLSALLIVLLAAGADAQPLASITVHGLDAERNEHDSVLVLVNESITLHPVALHPYIYFSERGDAVQDRYRDPRIGTNEPAALRLNRRLLDTIAARMRSLPNEKLHLLARAAKDADSRALAQRRCDSVRASLVAHGVDGRRITTTILVDRPAPRTLSEAGRTMLRSVELGGSAQLLAPMSTADTVRTYNPGSIRYHMTFPEAVENWKIRGLIEGRPYRLLAGEIAQTVLTDNILGPEAERMIAAGAVGATMEVTLPDSALYVTSPVTIPVHTVVVGRRVEHLPAGEPTSIDHLLLFPPDSSTLSLSTRTQLEELKRLIPEGSRVIVTGYADTSEATSDAGRKQISLDRARRVAETLRSFKPVYDGMGVAPEGMPLGTPEGHAFSRVVRLIVAPPQTEGRRP